jgi:hypothetical protein
MTKTNKAKIAVALLMALFIVGTLYAAIGANDLSSNAKKGWAWFFTKDQSANFSVWEGQLKAFIEANGVQLNIQRLNENDTRRETIKAITDSLRVVDDAKLTQIKATLGIQ